MQNKPTMAEPAASSPILLHAEITEEIYKSYLPVTRNKQKAIACADRVIAKLIQFYEQEAQDGAA